MTTVVSAANLLTINAARLLRGMRFFHVPHWYSPAKTAAINARGSIRPRTLIGNAVITCHVKPHALMLGVPAVQAGWMCRCGERLVLEEGRRSQAVALLYKAHSWNVLLQGADSVDSLSTAAKLAEVDKMFAKKVKP